ncbi:UPF0187-domain-containing protein [Peniophora sp. CONT]|nr:UPF0187-domain-containing protein [Peniophora sp. CONT]
MDDDQENEVHQAASFRPDPFSKRRSFASAILATALFRCWHILLFFGAWSTAICLISNYLVNLGIQSTLLTVLGTVLGFVISYRTTSSFERYNEGRRYWSQIVLASRTFARLVWFHVPATMTLPGVTNSEEISARVLLEKKTVINLTEAFAVAVKHYLRGEEGIYYVDLYHLVKYLPSYALPAGLPSQIDLHSPGSPTRPSHDHAFGSSTAKEQLNRRPSKSSFSSRSSAPQHGRGRKASDVGRPGAGLDTILASQPSSMPHLPLPATSPGYQTRPDNITLPAPTEKELMRENEIDKTPMRQKAADLSLTITSPTTGNAPRKSFGGKSSLANDGNIEEYLLPSRMPPKYSYFDIFPFSLLVRFLTKRGKEVKGKKGARLRAKLRSKAVQTHNLPLEISLYLSSYVAALQQRKAIDPPTTTLLLATIQQLVDALTGLERILTTPIPFSYSIHLWTVTLVYCFFLPFQLWNTLHWVTIPGTTIASFIFFGFIVAGEEIENPFGYDKNDLNMDHFTHNIIRAELRAITAAPAPEPSMWAFSPLNDAVFAPDAGFSGGPLSPRERGTPEEWIARGKNDMLRAMAIGAL